jgi:hypothetical protein
MPKDRLQEKNLRNADRPLPSNRALRAVHATRATDGGHMRGSWWQWLSAVLAIIFGLAFGWVAGTGVVQAASTAPMSGAAFNEEHGRGHFTSDGARIPARCFQGRLPVAMPGCVALTHDPQVRC